MEREYGEWRGRGEGTGAIGRDFERGVDVGEELFKVWEGEWGGRRV